MEKHIHITDVLLKQRIQRIRFAIEHQELTYGEIALRVPIHPKYLSQILCGHALPTQRLFERIEEVLYLRFPRYQIPHVNPDPRPCGHCGGLCPIMWIDAKASPEAMRQLSHREHDLLLRFASAPGYAITITDTALTQVLMRLRQKLETTPFAILNVREGRYRLVTKIRPK